MKMQQFRVRVARLTRPELSQLSDVSIATIQRVERGEKVSELTVAKLLNAFSTHLGRDVKSEEIEDLKFEDSGE